MKILDITEELRGNAYPGRGIVLGRTADDRYAVAAYFIMGRSENSRNRIFSDTEDGIRTEAFDPSKMVDPSLIIYHPVRLYDGRLIVTNGDQTDTVWEGMKAGKAPEEALRTREFEPDGPNYTPRISGVLEKDGSYQLSILKSFDGDPSCCKRFFFEYDKPVAGLGHFIHTYMGDGDPLPSFEGEPKTVRIEGDVSTFARSLWDSLNADNKVSLYVCYTELATGRQSRVVWNKNH
ncbi:IMP cyclohydrolase [Intestinibacillus massiliensis]|uniref:IMP cyclohydrolase n=1 Tax=Intestinibacillus massiliensis TaxID=1871029 RepID=UPI000B35A3A6|nr:IMP cyclohydrolase [Intestinibacillus massiliensis]